MQSLVENQGGLSVITEDFILGSISLIIWTMTLITTIKYVVIALRADNHHEGGIFSLYTLVRKMAKWLIIPALIGGATLLSDGALTPVVTVTTAVEGLKSVPGLGHIYSNQNIVVATTLAIITGLFIIQRFGTGFIGKIFGPVMLVWFSYLGISGFLNSLTNLAVYKAFNPYYAIHLLLSPENHQGLMILGSIFLATTGAEALYSDMGHVGRGNIYASWPFVKVCILLSYFGQGAWILSHTDSGIELNPFFASVPAGLSVFVVVLAALSAIIASQAMISGSFTLVSEAIRLKIFPMLKITYPGQSLGQLYIPVINWGLWIITSAIVLHFRTSAHMEAAYGLAITVTMLMTTILLTYYLLLQKIRPIFVYTLMAFFAFVELVFFAASAGKILHGGYVVVILAALIIFVMFIWLKSNQITKKYVKLLDLQKYQGQLDQLRKDHRYARYHTNVVYLTNRMEGHKIDYSILYSILDKKPKRAEVYWFVKVNVTDEPYTAEYTVDTMGTDFIVQVELFLGFRVRQEVPRYLRTIVQDMMATGQLKEQHQDYTVSPGRVVGDFRFIVLEERVANARQMPAFERFVLQTKGFIKRFTATPVRWFGLQFSEVSTKTVPLAMSDVTNLEIHPKA